MRKYVAYTAIALALAVAGPVWADEGGEMNGMLAGEQRVVAAQGEFVPDGNMDRAKISDDRKWKLNALFANEAEYDATFAKVSEDIASLESYKGHLGDPKMLAACLDTYFSTRLAANKLTLYANLELTTKQTDPKWSGKNEMALAQMADFIAKSAFVRSEILKLSDAAMAAAYSEQPSLQAYKGWIDQVRRRKAHVMSPDVERVLSLAGDNQFAEIDLNELPSGYEKAFQALYSDIKLPMITDESGNKVQLTFSNYAKYRASSDRRVRKETVDKFFGALNDYRHTFAAIMAGQVNFSVFLARSRGYDSALAAYLDKDDIDVAVYHNLVDSVRANIAPLHRYVALRKARMGLKEIHHYDLYPTMVDSVKRDIPYEEALATLPKALAVLGPNYIKELSKGLDPANGWADVYPHRDKDSGASCASVFGVHPFVKLNYFNESDDMSTVAHEYGHAMHSNLSFNNQPYATAGYTSFIAEVASTCNEKILSDYLIAHAKTDEEKLYLLNEMVDRIRSTIYRQAMFADFELEIHEAAEKGVPLTADFLNKTYTDLLRTYYGPDFTIDKNDGIEWAYIPHLYYKFYVYSYATGMSSGIAIANRVEKEGAPARDQYLKMLSSGCSETPVDLLKIAGVDITKPDAIVAAAGVMNQMLDEMESIMNKQGSKK